MNGMDVFLSSGQVSSLTIAAGGDNCAKEQMKKGGPACHADQLQFGEHPQ